MKTYVAIYSIIYDTSLKKTLEILEVFLKKKKNIRVIENGSSIDYEDERLELSSEPYPLDDITINENANHLLTWNFKASLSEAEIFIYKVIQVLQRESISYKFDYEEVNEDGESISKEFTIKS